jgi:hypothetical protein
MNEKRKNSGRTLYVPLPVPSCPSWPSFMCPVVLGLRSTPLWSFVGGLRRGVASWWCRFAWRSRFDTSCVVVVVMSSRRRFGRLRRDVVVAVVF